jgi:type IV pilus assembly protein PilM
VQGLRDLLGERFEAGVENLNPFNSVTYNPRDFDPDFINDVAPSAAIAVGLAARKIGDR